MNKTNQVVFLDFDGVLNSEASFRMEKRRGNECIYDTLCYVCCSNFQSLLDNFPNLRIVISSTWRKLHSLDYLKNKLKEYGVDSSKVVGVTPVVSLSGVPRSREIREWLENNPVSSFVIIDDDSDCAIKGLWHKFVQTDWRTGLTLENVELAGKILQGEYNV